MEAIAQTYSTAGFIPFTVAVSVEADKKIIKPPTKWSSFTNATPGRVKRNHNGLALRTGAAGQVIVVDVDGLPDWLKFLADKDYPEPETCTQTSQSGGRHYFFAWENKFEALKSTSKVIPGLDVDLRGNGGMIVCFPTAVCYPNGVIKQYTWMPGKALVGPDACELGDMPEWLWTLLSNRDSQATRGNSQVVQHAPRHHTTTSPEDDEEVPQSLVDYIVEQYGFFPEQVEKLIYKEESKTFIVQTSEKKCMFLRRNHSSNHQYFVIKANGEITRQCHSGNCKGKQFGKQVLSDDLLKCLASLYPEQPVVDMALVEQAREEANQNAMDLYRGGKNVKMDRVEDTIRGDLESFFGNRKCLDCKVGQLVCVTKAGGTYVHCSLCTFRFPGGSTVIPFDQEKYPNLNRFFIVVNVNNTTNNNYYAQEDSSIGWNEFASDGLSILEEDSENNLLLLKSLAGTQTRIADVFYALFGHQYMFGNNQWYKFETPVWRRVSEHDVKFDVRSNAFLGLFTKALDVYKLSTGVPRLEQKLKEIQNVITKLETDNFQGSIVNQIIARYSKQFPDFLNKLDQNKNILGFTNGVVDLASGGFREGLPTDFVSRTVGYEFDTEKMGDSDITNEILDFFSKVFPDCDVREYVFKFLSSLLAGYTKDQLFHFGNGMGSNGKGVLLQLMQAVLGELSQKTESSFICGAIPDANAPTPALTALVGKRFVYISEVVEGAKINESFFKQLSGQDRLTYRPLYGESRTFVPDFKLFMVCNDLPRFNGADAAMKRRVRVIPFVSTFTDTEPEDPVRNIYAKDDTLIDRLEAWKLPMIGILLKYYQKYLHEGLKNLPPAIAKFTQEYQIENDACGRFVKECLVQDVIEVSDENRLKLSRIKIDDVLVRFDQWKTENGISGTSPRNHTVHGIEKVLYGASRTNTERKIPFPGEKNRLPGIEGWSFRQ